MRDGRSILKERCDACALFTCVFGVMGVRAGADAILRGCCVKKIDGDAAGGGIGEGPADGGKDDASERGEEWANVLCIAVSAIENCLS